MVRPLGKNPKVGVRVSHRSRYFLSQILRHFHKNIRSRVDNESYFLCTGNISNVNFTTKILIDALTSNAGHYNDVIMSAMGSQITSLTIVYSPVYSRRRWKKAQKFRVTGLCEGNSPVTGELPAQKANNAESVSIWWRHHLSNYTPLENIKQAVRRRYYMDIHYMGCLYGLSYQLKICIVYIFAQHLFKVLISI